MPLPAHAHALGTGLCLLAGLVLVVGCENPLPTDPADIEDVGVEGVDLDRGPNRLDVDLRRLLIERAGRGGLAYFMLTESHQLGRIPQDPNNRLTPAKVALGQLLFHETALAVNNLRPEGRETYACASCHPAPGGFFANLPQGIAEGGTGFGLRGEARRLNPDYADFHTPADALPIRVPAALNLGYQELVLWNGQFGGVGDNLGTEHRWTAGTPLASNFLGLEGVETQAHAGLQVHRMASIRDSRVATIPRYRQMFAEAFPGHPDPINRLNAALAIAAFERTVTASRSPFQAWLRGDLDAMATEEKRGAVLFFGRAGCVTCHTGPALNSMSFHALGMEDLDASYAADLVTFSLQGGSLPEDTRLGRGGFTGRAEDNYKFKVPQLYNLKDSPFYGHGATFGSIREVVRYKNEAVPDKVVPGISPLFTPLGLTAAEVNDLVAFLEHALYDPDLLRFMPTELPSGNCTPVNDDLARLELGCAP